MYTVQVPISLFIIRDNEDFQKRIYDTTLRFGHRNDPPSRINSLQATN